MTDEGLSENHFEEKETSLEGKGGFFAFFGAYLMTFAFALGVFILFQIPFQASSFFLNDSKIYCVNSQNITLASQALNAKNDPFSVGGYNIKVEGGAVRQDPSFSFFESELFREKQDEIYIVRENDTVSEIAEMFKISANTIVWANDLGKYIYEGQHLVVLPFTGVRHQIKEGDTVSKIAKEYTVSTEDILDFNRIQEDEKLVTGNFIDVPGGVKKAPVTRPREVVSQPISPVVYNNQTVSVASGYFIRPVRGGIRTQGLHGRNAVDIAAPIGTPIYAAADGQVVVSGWHGGYGYYIVINHPNNTSTLYAHHSRNLVGVGEWVKQGRIIAEMGSTGYSTGPHIHFEVHGAVNPF